MGILEGGRDALGLVRRPNETDAAYQLRCAHEENASLRTRLAAMDEKVKRLDEIRRGLMDAESERTNQLGRAETRLAAAERDAFAWKMTAKAETAALDAVEAALRRNLPVIEMYGNLADCEAAHAALSPEALSPASAPDHEKLLGSLLARIHRDGGHYVMQHGWEKAVTDADALVVGWLAKDDEPSPASAAPARIVAAAIHQGGVTFTGPHHHQIIRYMAALLGSPVRGEQGFVTSEGRYVNRIEAASVARAAGQINQHEGSTLFSERLWEVPDWIFCPTAAPPAPKSTGAVERQVACGPLDTLIVHPESQTCKHCEGEADRG